MDQGDGAAEQIGEGVPGSHAPPRCKPLHDPAETHANREPQRNVGGRRPAAPPRVPEQMQTSSAQAPDG